MGICLLVVLVVWDNGAAKVEKVAHQLYALHWQMSEEVTALVYIEEKL